ncbi:MAG: hypothetical protein HC805_07885 [Alkalinema sp. RL_2_19]|nr:hypothetical protein [Alkalinema sp. RL_2_19]
MTMGLQFLLNWLRQVVLTKLTSNNDDDSNAPTSLTNGWAINLLIWCARVGLWISSILYITNLFSLTRRWSAEFSRVAWDSISSPLLTLGNISYSLIELMTLGGVVIAWIIITSILSNWLKKTVLGAARVDRGTKEIIATFSRYALIAIGILILLQAWGINISSLAIVASALGWGLASAYKTWPKTLAAALSCYLSD